MTQVRVYLPMSAPHLRALAAAAESASGPVPAFAVTERLERSLAADLLEEELEYAALCDAVLAAGALRAGPMDKRVVAAADVDGGTVGTRTGEGRTALTAVVVSGPVPLSSIVSFHVDEQGGAEGTDDLLWYDVTELGEVLRLL